MLSVENMCDIIEAVETVKKAKSNGRKCTLELPLEECTAKVYHMGQQNPIIRIDIKEEK